MAIARTGVYVDDYLDLMLKETREHTKCLLSQSSKKATPEQEEMIEKLRKELETNQETTLSLCTEKVLLAQQAYDLVSFGDMIACDNENCEGGEWFHYACVGLSSETRFKGKWFCPTCRLLPRKGASDHSA